MNVALTKKNPDYATKMLFLQQKKLLTEVLHKQIQNAKRRSTYLFCNESYDKLFVVLQIGTTFATEQTRSPFVEILQVYGGIYIFWLRPTYSLDCNTQII